MKLRLTAMLLACAVSASAYAQKEPAEVTDGEIAKYKNTSESDCRAGAAGKGDPADVAAFCGCIFASLNKTMTRPEWQQAYFYTQKGEEPRVREILAPHLKQATCRPQGAAAQAPAAPPPAAAEKPLDLKLRVR
jgi:hypothetical protein